MKRRVAIVLMLSLIFTMLPASNVAAASKKPGKVAIQQTTQVNSNVYLKWKKVKGAKKYQIYERTKYTKWRLVKTVKGKKTSATIKSKYGITFSYKIRAVKGKKKGKFSNPVTLHVTRNPWAIGKWRLYRIDYANGESEYIDMMDAESARMWAWTIVNRVDGSSSMTTRNGTTTSYWQDYAGQYGHIFMGGDFIRINDIEMYNVFNGDKFVYQKTYY